MDIPVKQTIVWKNTQQLFLVLDPGTLSTSFYMPAMLGIDPVKEYGKNSFQKAQMVLGSKAPQIVCFIQKIQPCALESLKASSNFSHIEEVLIDEIWINRVFYDVPRELYNDYKMFSLGYYSKISAYSRERIKNISGLRYRVPSGDNFIYDKKLLVLEKSPILRTYIETFLDVKIDEDAELLDIPGYDDYYIAD